MLFKTCGFKILFQYVEHLGFQMFGFTFKLSFFVCSVSLSTLPMPWMPWYRFDRNVTIFDQFLCFDCCFFLFDLFPASGLCRLKLVLRFFIYHNIKSIYIISWIWYLFYWYLRYSIVIEMPFVNLLTFWQFQNPLISNSIPEYNKQISRTAKQKSDQWSISLIWSKTFQKKKKMIFCELHHQTERWKKVVSHFPNDFIYKTIWFHSLSVVGDNFCSNIRFFVWWFSSVLVYCLSFFGALFAFIIVPYHVLVAAVIFNSPSFFSLFLLSQTEKPLTVF